MKLASDSEAVRRKYLYRRLVMTDGRKLPVRLAMKLVGPDCAYHLYSQIDADKKTKGKKS